MAYTTAHLLAAINRRSFAPTGQTTFSEAELLLMADEELKTLVVPHILAAREEFFVFHKDHDVIAAKFAYPISARAIGMVTREVQLLNGNNATDLPRIEPEAVVDYGTGAVSSFYLKNNDVCLYKSPSSTSGTLRIYYFLRPGDLVTLAESAVISAIDTVTNVASVTTIPSAWVTGNSFDFIKKDGGHEYVSIDNTSSLVSGTDITFATLPSTLAVGDYVSLAGQSPLVQLPPDYQPILAQATAVQVLEAMNQPGAEKAESRLKRMLEVAQILITPRVIGESRVVLQNWF